MMDAGDGLDYAKDLAFLTAMPLVLGGIILCYLLGPPRPDTWPVAQAQSTAGKVCVLQREASRGETGQCIQRQVINWAG
ncbi:hypothetical protein [Parachitinimonas caeni]|uniref:Uncharacterized protein n=1 Tax=Parachitinimonas caeni TaxID=3031301 RepID=A0ABT7DVQ1_9NEIS|nr:hypothetical protein [Parachitinimonas caeni]MDK2124127.1 hypothetical protein [Parachitinimonas caeni]